MPRKREDNDTEVVEDSSVTENDVDPDIEI